MPSWPKSSLLVFALMCSSFLSFSQLITLSGKVIDAKTGSPLPGATVIAGKAGTSTDKNGEFVLLADQIDAVKNGIRARFIGYRETKLPYAGTIYQFKLIADPKQLQTVVISGNTETIVQKAFRRIPFNYANKAFHLLGLVNMVHSARDTNGYQYFYKNRASVKLYYKPYIEQETPQIALLNKKDSVAFNRNSGFSVRYVSGYTSITKFDLVNARANFLKGDPKQYTYQLNGKEWLNGERVFVVNFFANVRNKLNGTLYIDTVNYTFTKITYTVYNIKPGVFIATDKRLVTVKYCKQATGWAYNNLLINSVTKHDGFDIERITEFKAVDLDTTKAAPLPYQAVIPSMMEDRNIVAAKAIPISAADSLKLEIDNKKADTTFVFVPAPAVSTGGKPSALQRILTGYRNFIVGDNLRLGWGIARLPLNAAGYQPLLGKSVGPVGNYFLANDFQLRLIPRQELFLQLSNGFNLGLGGINVNHQAYCLLYNFTFNKGGHPITLSPHAGYSIINIKNKKTELYQQQAWVYGLNLSYELSPRVNAFAGARYYQTTKTTNGGLVVQKQPVLINAGFIFKVKF